MARIRTLKPEFWSHKKLSKQQDSVKLLAIALLNFCDDEGFFYYDSTILRNFARPHDKNVHEIEKSFAKLCEIGYVKIGRNTEGDLVGKVVKFLEHQTINRPTPSKIKLTCVNTTFTEDSLRTHGVFTEDSLPERKGKERKGRERGERARVHEENPIFSHADYQDVFEQMTGQIWIEQICATRQWNYDDFFYFVQKWMEQKKTTGDYQYPVRRLKTFAVLDYEKFMQKKSSEVKGSKVEHNQSELDEALELLNRQ